MIRTRTAGAAGAALILAAILSWGLPHRDHVTAIGAEIKKVDGVDIYRLQAETDRGKPSVYRNEDSWVHLKFASADLQARFTAMGKDGASVSIRHYGWRIPILSAFPNALSVREEPESARPSRSWIRTGLLVLLPAGLFAGLARRRKAPAAPDARDGNAS